MSEIYTVEQIDDGTYRIDEFGRDNCYLLVGSERALLIDCSIGLGGIAEVVRSLTDKPVTVAATHAHGDHTGGAAQFDSVYVPRAENIAFFKMINAAYFRSKLISNKMKQNGITDKLLKQHRGRAKWISYDDGAQFDLGSRKITAVLTPGHSPGSTVFLDSGRRLMFTGDNTGPVLLTDVERALTIEQWLPGAQKTLELSGEYQPWCSHSNGRQTREQIERVIRYAGEIMEKYPENEKRRRRVTYPELSSDGCIIFDASRIHFNAKGR